MMGLIGPDRYRGGAVGVTRGVAGGRNPYSEDIQKEGGDFLASRVLQIKI